MNARNDGLITIRSPLPNLSSVRVLELLGTRVAPGTPHANVAAATTAGAQGVLEQRVRCQKGVDITVLVKINRNKPAGDFAKSYADIASLSSLAR